MGVFQRAHAVFLALAVVYAAAALLPRTTTSRVAEVPASSLDLPTAPG
jgi:hypothetical protein